MTPQHVQTTTEHAPILTRPVYWDSRYEFRSNLSKQTSNKQTLNKSKNKSESGLTTKVKEAHMIFTLSVP